MISENEYQIKVSGRAIRRVMDSGRRLNDAALVSIDLALPQVERMSAREYRRAVDRAQRGG